MLAHRHSTENVHICRVLFKGIRFLPLALFCLTAVWLTPAFHRSSTIAYTVHSVFLSDDSLVDIEVHSALSRSVFIRRLPG